MMQEPPEKVEDISFFSYLLATVSLTDGAVYTWRHLMNKSLCRALGVWRALRVTKCTFLVFRIPTNSRRSLLQFLKGMAVFRLLFFIKTSFPIVLLPITLKHNVPLQLHPSPRLFWVLWTDYQGAAQLMVKSKTLGSTIQYGSQLPHVATNHLQ